MNHQLVPLADLHRVRALLGSAPGCRRHACPLTAKVEFFVVIDEQHRFGIEQRLGLYAKGRDADTMPMSAPPIPRTLMMTIWRSRHLAPDRKASCVRPRTGFASPRRICGCAAPARCWAPVRAACRPCASPILRSTKNWLRSEMGWLGRRGRPQKITATGRREHLSQPALMERSCGCPLFVRRSQPLVGAAV